MPKGLRSEHSALQIRSGVVHSPHRYGRKGKQGWGGEVMGAVLITLLGMMGINRGGIGSRGRAHSSQCAAAAAIERVP